MLGMQENQNQRGANNDKQKKWEPPIGYIPESQKKWEPPVGYTPKQKEIVNSIDRDIEELFDEDALFTDISRETEYINNKFDKLLNDIEHMKDTVENIKKHNNIIAITMHITKGSEPLRILFRGISGAIPFMT